MDPAPPLTLAESLAAAQGWWREAGVDLDYRDEPQTWLAPEPVEGEATPRVPDAAPEPVRPRIGGDPTAWPRDLAGFRQWWLEEPSLDPAGTRGRVAPRGAAEAPLMVLVTMPEADDSDTLLSGSAGRLVANMARAMGFTPDETYVAAALPRHTPLPDWPALTADGLGDVLLHHLALAAPQRLIVLGRDVLPLLGHDPAQSAPLVSEMAIQGRKLPLLATYAPGRLLEHTRHRAELWRRWLEWTGPTGE
jgi:uracil-DNA glycosylase